MDKKEKRKNDEAQYEVFPFLYSMRFAIAILWTGIFFWICPIITFSLSAGFAMLAWFFGGEPDLPSSSFLLILIMVFAAWASVLVSHKILEMLVYVLTFSRNSQSKQKH